MRLNWAKILRIRRRMRSGFYCDPGICATLLDHCAESLLREVMSEREGTPEAPERGRRTVPIVR